MSILLTEQEIWKSDDIMSVNAEAGLPFEILAQLARAIQLALIEKLRKEPACYVYPDFFQCIEVAGTWTAYLRDAVTPDAPNGREPLYRIPTPQELEES